MNKRYVLVDAISQFRMRYVVEIPENVENPTEEGLYPCTPIQYAEDTVTCGDVKEFTQKHIGESILDSREVTLDEAFKIFRSEEPYFDKWTDKQIYRSCITPIGYEENKLQDELFEEFQREADSGDERN